MGIIEAGIGAASSAFGQWMQNRENKASAKRQMDFQERMSNTAYQRSMADMKTAGLNPILAMGGSGASSPGGASYQAGNVGEAAVAGASSASGTKLNEAKADITRLQEEITEKNMPAAEIEKKVVGGISNVLTKVQQAWENGEDINQIAGVIEQGVNAIGEAGTAAKRAAERTLQRGLNNLGEFGNHLKSYINENKKYEVR